MKKKTTLKIIDKAIGTCKAAAIAATVLITAPEALPVLSESNNIAEAIQAIAMLIC